MTKRSTPVSGRDPGGRIGRRVAMFIYWTFMVYIAVVGFGSIIPQVFWPNAADADDSIACVDHVQNMERELLSFAAGHIISPELENGPLLEWSDQPVRDEIGAWFRAWDARFLPQYERCGDASKRLFQLRHRLETSMRRYAREEGARIQHSPATQQSSAGEASP